MKKNIILAVAIIVAATILAIGCIHQNKKPKETITDPISLGSILILTGEGSSWGEASRNGIDMAINEINHSGGVLDRPLQITHEDDAGDPKTALAAYQKLTQTDDINIIIGTSWSITGLPIMDKAVEDKTLMFSPSLGVAKFNEQSPYLFNTWPHDELLSRKLADYVYNLGHTHVALIGAEQVWVKEQTNAFISRFEELGGSIDVLLEPKPEDRELTTEALKIKEKPDELDAIVSTTDGVLVGTLVAKEVRSLGVDLPIYSITVDEDIITASEGAYEGMQYYTSLTPTEEFKQKYINTYGIDPDIGADTAYDAVMLIAQAIKKTGSTDTTILSEYLNSLKTYSGASGDLTFDGKGGVTKPFVLMEVHNGKAATIK